MEEKTTSLTPNRDQSRTTNGASSVLHRQQAVLMLLSLGLIQSAAARKAGVDPITVSRWTRQPEFIRRFKGLMQGIDEVVSERVKVGYALAIETLNDLLQSKDKSVRRRAAQVLKDTLAQSRQESGGEG